MSQAHPPPRALSRPGPSDHCTADFKLRTASPSPHFDRRDGANIAKALRPVPPTLIDDDYDDGEVEEEEEDEEVKEEEEEEQEE